MMGVEMTYTGVYPERSRGDALNRIATAKTQATTGTYAWGLGFGYDIWGNLLSASVTQGSAPMLSQSVDANNRISGDCYDAAGNLLAEAPPPCPAPTYIYNAENQLTATAGVTYTYDGDGKRVQKSNGKLYWYGMGSDPLAESDLSGTISDEYIFFGGKRISRRHIVSGQPDAISYYFADHLGTSRVVTSVTGTVLDDSDFYPFGGERAVVSSSGNAYKFTGKERDAESGLDNFGARYDSSSMGRFMSPDSPSYSNHKNPQSWNLYAYSLNNPVTFRDEDGHEIVCANNTQQCRKDAAAATGNAEAAKRVTTNTVTTKHSFLGIHWTTSKTTIAISGDINSFRALSSNASKLADLVTTNKTVTVSYDVSPSHYPTPSLFGQPQNINGGSTSFTEHQGYSFQAYIDPVNQSWNGKPFDQDAVDQGLPQANTAEEFGHEVLGHIWGEIFGGAPAGTRANMRDSIIGENAVRALDPTRGQKGLESHHGYQDMPPDKPQQ